MWSFWLLLVLWSIGVVILQAGLLVRDKLNRVAVHDEEGSAGQRRLLKALRVAGCIGLAIIWGALVYLLIDTGGLYLIQPWQNRTLAQAVAWSLLYTSYVLGLMRPPNFQPSASWRLQAFTGIIFFTVAFATIVDLYLSPPTG